MRSPHTNDDVVPTAAVPHAIFDAIRQFDTCTIAYRVRSADHPCQATPTILLEIAARIPEAACEIRAKEQEIIDLCQSPVFSLEKLLKAVQT